MTTRGAIWDVLRQAEHDLCRVARRGGACMAACQSRAAAGMPRWSRWGAETGGRDSAESGAGARQPQSGDRRGCKAALRCRVK